MMGMDEWEGMPGVTRYSSTYKPKEGFIILEGSNPQEYSKITNLTDSEREVLIEFFEGQFQEKEGFWFGWVNKDRAGYTVGSKSVATCAFDASESYMKHHLGMCLDESDRLWYKSHPVTVSNGLPQHYTLTVLHDLVAPYGLGIKKVYVKRGSGPSEEQKIWWDVLGVNPIARSTQLCSNDEFLDEQSGGDPEVRRMLAESIGPMNFDYVDEIPGGAIICQGSNFGGHASYKGPRAVPTGWTIGLTLDRLENCTYLNTPPCFPYTPVATLDYRKCKAKNGKTFSDLLSEKHKSKFGSGSTHYTRGGNTVNTPPAQGPAKRAPDQESGEDSFFSEWAALGSPEPPTMKVNGVETAFIDGQWIPVKDIQPYQPSKNKGAVDFEEELEGAKGETKHLIEQCDVFERGVDTEIVWDTPGFDNFLTLYSGNDVTMQDSFLTVSPLRWANILNNLLTSQKGLRWVEKNYQHMIAGDMDKVSWSDNKISYRALMTVTEITEAYIGASYADLFVLFSLLDSRIHSIFNIIYESLMEWGKKAGKEAPIDIEVSLPERSLAYSGIS